MSLAVDVTAEGVRVPLSRDRVAELVRGVLRAERVRDALLSFTFLAPAAIARLNREHLGHRGPTDVITFAMGAGAPGVPGVPVVADVYICPEIVRENARDGGVGVREELARVVIHGTLHALGHEHPEDEGRTGSPMWRRQEALLRRLYTAARA
ncbi:MAG TPA: rRNA maturation RNase YbeY [Gemmatimonadales bacterium]